MLVDYYLSVNFLRALTVSPLALKRFIQKTRESSLGVLAVGLIDHVPF